MGSIPKHQTKIPQNRVVNKLTQHQATLGPRKAMGGDKGKQSNGRSTWQFRAQNLQAIFPCENPNLHIDTSNSWSSMKFQTHPRIQMVVSVGWFQTLGIIVSFHHFHPSKNGWMEKMVVSKFGISWNPGVYFQGRLLLVSGRVYTRRNPLRSIFVCRGMLKQADKARSSSDESSSNSRGCGCIYLVCWYAYMLYTVQCVYPSWNLHSTGKMASQNETSFPAIHVQGRNC